MSRPCEQDRGVALGGVAILFADDAFELAQAHAVFVGHLGFCVDVLALFKCRPQALVAHDDGVDDTKSVEGVLILAQNGNFLGADDGALLGVKITGQHLHEGGFAGAVRAGQAITASGDKSGGYILKEDLCAVAHAYIVD